MTNQEALAILKDSMTYSTKENPAKNMNNAIGCFAELNGWTKEDAPVKMVELCLAGAEIYKNNHIHTYMLKDANDASNVDLYLDKQAGRDILAQRAGK